MCSITAIEAGVVDEYHLVTHPVIAGGGKKLFGTGVRLKRTLSCAEFQETFKSSAGIARLHIGECVNLKSRSRIAIADDEASVIRVACLDTPQAYAVRARHFVSSALCHLRVVEVDERADSLSGDHKKSGTQLRYREITHRVNDSHVGRRFSSKR